MPLVSLDSPPGAKADIGGRPIMSDPAPAGNACNSPNANKQRM